MKRLVIPLFAMATAVVLWAVAGSAQSEDQATFTSMVEQKFEARSELAKVTREEESTLMSEGYVEIGAISASQPGNKSTAELAHRLESAIVNKAAEVGGDVVFFSREGELRATQVPDGSTERRSECVHSHVTESVEPCGGIGCVPPVISRIVCDKSEKITRPKFKTVKSVISEAMVWRHDPELLAEINSRISLHQAAEHGKKGVVQWLIAHGAEIDAKDKKGDTPLHFAASFGQRDVVELLLANKADVNARDNKGRTPLHFAEDEHHKDVAELLRQHGGRE